MLNLYLCSSIWLKLLYRVTPIAGELMDGFVLRVDHSDSHSLRYAAFEAVWPMHTYVITKGI